MKIFPKNILTMGVFLLWFNDTEDIEHMNSHLMVHMLLQSIFQKQRVSLLLDKLHDSGSSNESLTLTTFEIFSD
jgi:hypothetical protein